QRGLDYRLGAAEGALGPEHVDCDALPRSKVVVLEGDGVARPFHRTAARVATEVFVTGEADRVDRIRRARHADACELDRRVPVVAGRVPVERVDGGTVVENVRVEGTLDVVADDVAL